MKTNYPNEMPECLQGFLPHLSVEQAEDVWAYLQENPNATDQMVECVLRAHPGLAESAVGDATQDRKPPTTPEELILHFEQHGILRNGMRIFEFDDRNIARMGDGRYVVSLRTATKPRETWGGLNLTPVEEVIAMFAEGGEG